MRVLSFILIESGTYGDQFHRPFTTVTDGRGGITRNGVQRIAAATGNGANLTPAALAGTAGAVIRPDINANVPVVIDNGWDNTRFTFMLAVEHQEMAGSATIQYLTGYTDHKGISQLTSKPNFDPNMRLYFNNSITTRRIPVMTATGRGWEQRVVDADQLLMGSYSPSIRNLEHVQHSLRPMDLFTNLEVSGAYDTRTTFFEGIKKSKRSNGLAPTYLSRSLSAMKAAVTDPTSNGVSHHEMMGSAAGNAAEGTLAHDEFFSLMQSRTAFGTDKSVTLKDLVSWDPNAMSDQVMHVTLRPKFQQARTSLTEGFHDRGNSESWQGRDNETLFATILSSAVPAIMADLMLVKVAFTATNRTVDGSWQIGIGGIRGFADGLDLSQHGQQFLTFLETRVLRDLTLNNLISVDLSCVIDLLYDSRMEISIDGAPHVAYCTPQFSDGLFSPVIAGNYSAVTSLANDIEALSENLMVDRSPEVSQYSIHSMMGRNYGSASSETV